MGRKPLQLGGQHFGRLTVIERVKTENIHNSSWLCRCDCGNVHIVSGSALKNGKTLSCGCYNKDVQSGRYKDLIGQKFGRLTVIEKTGESKHRSPLWKCKCDCGKICIVSAKNLGKSVSSCGCLKRDLILEDCVEETRLRNLTKKRPVRIGKDSGCKGVVWVKAKNKWKAEIVISKKHYHLGYFREQDLDRAIITRKRAEQDLFDPVLEKYGKPTTEEKV